MPVGASALCWQGYTDSPIAGKNFSPFVRLGCAHFLKVLLLSIIISIIIVSIRIIILIVVAYLCIFVLFFKLQMSI